VLYTPSVLSKSRLFTHERYAILLVFTLCIALRATPELVAYPQPIGYDVINYYIPTITNFEHKWDTMSKQFPLYVTFLYIISVMTGLSAYSVVAAIIIVMTGIFGISLFYLLRNLLKVGVCHSAYISTFTVVQLAVLRTTWDFHRDIFALTIMMFVFSLLIRKNGGWKYLAIILVLTTLTVAADRMVGALFSVSLVVYAILTRRRGVALTGIFAMAMFCALSVSTQSAPDIKTITSTEIPQNNTELKQFYNPADLLISFVVTNGLLVAAAAIGFLKTKNNSLLLKIPLLVCLMGSFSWLVFPENRHLLADRWIILAGIFLSVFAGYGVLHLVKNLKKRVTIAGCILGAFAVLGVSYAVVPYHSASALYGIVGLHSKDLPPLTMQFNSIDVEDNDDLLSAIAWINKNTEQDALIVGESHLRGFMELYLENNRTYYFSEDPQTFAETLMNRGQQVYLIEFNSTSSPKFVVKDIGNR
jgi:hypothetical protein